LAETAISGVVTNTSARIRVKANFRFFIVQPFLPIVLVWKRLSDTFGRESFHLGANIKVVQAGSLCYLFQMPAPRPSFKMLTPSPDGHNYQLDPFGLPNLDSIGQTQGSDASGTDPVAGYRKPADPFEGGLPPAVMIISTQLLSNLFRSRTCPADRRAADKSAV
jgi:hypothetical protein